MTASGEGELRAARRERVFDAMEAAGLDALVFGRRDSIAYATGARSLWTAGTRPFGPACVLVSAGRTTHLLSTWDAGVPPDVPFEHLYGITWNPATMAASLGAIPSLAEARRIGVEALSPGFVRMMSRVAPGAELVAADDLLHAVRAVKLPGEIERIRAATVVARAGVDAAAGALADGSTPGGARAAAIRAVAAHGVTVPSSGVLVREVASSHDEVATPDGPVPAGPSGIGWIYVDVGVLVDGYEGGLGRTVRRPRATDDVDGAVQQAQEQLLDACRPGATGSDLQAAAGGLTRWMVRGSGMGFEAPVITDKLGGRARIETGMALSVDVHLGGWSHRDVVLVDAAADATVFL